MTQNTTSQQKARLVLADGTTFEGVAFGALAPTAGEAVFTTVSSGYEEVLTDPSYAGQIVVMTSPEMGNVGITRSDLEANVPHLVGFVVRSLSPLPSNWRSQETLSEYLTRSNVAGLTEIDTRALTQHLRENGSQNGAIGTASRDELLAKARAHRDMRGLDLVREVTPKERFAWTEPSDPAFFASAQRADHHVVAIDFGMKRNILRRLVDEGARVTVVPATTSAKDILALAPDGIFLSNGPGDPSAVPYAIETIRELLGKRPIFGICLGHQLLALALGAKTYKLKFGHRGANQPVKELDTGRVEITTQNHGFAVDLETLPKNVRATHQHLNDQTSEGLESVEHGAFSVQFHPEAAAGPHDSAHLFAQFARRIRATQGAPAAS